MAPASGMAAARPRLWAPAAALLLALVPFAPAKANEPASACSCYDQDHIGPLIELDAGGPLKATIAPQLGGQLVGLTYREEHGEVQLLYRGMDFCPEEGWGGKAPILWPATGRNVNPAVPRGLGWHWNGQDYPMPIHGFARDLRWQVVGRNRSETSDSVTLELRPSAETRLHFPFDFILQVEFRLDDTVLTISHRVDAAAENTDVMPFSIGNHITFRQPLSPGGTMTVTSPATRRLVLDGAGRPVSTEEFTPLHNFPASAFANEVAVPLAGFAEEPWLELADSGGLSIRLEHTASSPADEGTVMFNLWANSALGFFSPEPWFGRQNSLVDGIGLMRLSPDETFDWQLRVTVSR